MDINTAELIIKLIKEKKTIENRINILKNEGVRGIMTGSNTGVILEDKKLKSELYNSVLAYLNRERDLIVAEIKEL